MLKIFLTSSICNSFVLFLLPYYQNLVHFTNSEKEKIKRLYILEKKDKIGIYGCFEYQFMQGIRNEWRIHIKINDLLGRIESEEVKLWWAKY